jgi:hypothetical protein
MLRQAPCVFPATSRAVPRVNGADMSISPSWESTVVPTSSIGAYAPHRAPHDSHSRESSCQLALCNGKPLRD